MFLSLKLNRIFVVTYVWNNCFYLIILSLSTRIYISPSIKIQEVKMHARSCFRWRKWNGTVIIISDRLDDYASLSRSVSFNSSTWEDNKAGMPRWQGPRLSSKGLWVRSPEAWWTSGTRFPYIKVAVYGSWTIFPTPKSRGKQLAITVRLDC